MSERFTERARQVVVLAQAEARALKHNPPVADEVAAELERLRTEKELAVTRSCSQPSASRSDCSSAG